MPDRKTRTLSPAVLAADRDSLAALAAITDYAPANPDYSLQSLTTAARDLDDKVAAATQADAEAKAKRDDAVAAAWEFHTKVVGMRDSVGAQYTKASNQFQSVGRKKTTEYKKPGNRSGTKNNPQT